MKLIVLLYCLFLTSFANATTYYVSNTGNNRYDGLTPGTSWQTLSRVQIAANSGLMKPGDKILFKRGDKFAGNLTWSSIYGHKAPSGTAAAPIVFATYGSGPKPIFQYQSDFEKNPEKKVLFFVAGVDYIIFDGLNITDLNFPKDDKVTPANCGIAFNFGAFGDATSNHCIVRNTDMSNIGMGIVLIGDSNRIDSCTFVDLKNLKNTFGNDFPENDDDYGANGVTITGNDNTIAHSLFSGNWAESYDYGFSGGAIESFGSCSRNKIIYNTIIDCNGVMEIGSSKGGVAADNLIANNLLINNGGMTYVNISGTFAIQASNIQYFNNTIIDIGNRYKDFALFTFNGKPEAETVFNIRNNVFYLEKGMTFTKSGTDLSKFSHDNNLFELKDDSKINIPLSPRDMISKQNIFKDLPPKNVHDWRPQLSETFRNKKSGYSFPVDVKDVGNGTSQISAPASPAAARHISNAFYAVVMQKNTRELKWLMRVLYLFTGEYIQAV